MNPMYQGSQVTFDNFDTSSMTWDYIGQLREATSMKIVIKGLVTREDAANAVQAGVDAVYVSNHGGRAEASGFGAIESLPEVVAAVDGNVPVIVDSGFRQGNGHLQGAGHGRGCRQHRPRLYLGPGRVWSAWRGESAGDAECRTGHGDGADGGAACGGYWAEVYWGQGLTAGCMHPGPMTFGNK